MLSELRQLQQQFPTLICDVRGVGLFVGLEFVTCPVAKTPAPLAAKTLKEGAKARGVLLTSDGPVGHVVKIKPPMVFGVKEVDHMVQVMRCVAARAQWVGAGA
jgi:4-aminobutyrate aminotransferase-like enzyme